MKNKLVFRIIITTSTLTVMSISAVGAAFFSFKGFQKAEAISLPTSLNLSDCSDEEIQTYYSSLNGKSEDELSGTNLLKNLKGIIRNGVQYFSYDQDTSIFVITDRDWTNSPATSLPGTYNPSTETVTGYSHSSDISSNPYIHMAYCDYSVKDKTRYSGDGDVSTSTKSFDNEHAWSQSHGFSASGDNSTGAGSDLHHLIAGTQYGNRTLHSNYSYGFVKTNDWSDASKTYEQKNKRGTPLFTHTEDEEARVFEPQDSDKGDIARALLYMVACYNNYDGSAPTKTMPALKLVNYVIDSDTTGYSSDDLKKGYYGILEDLLAWHHMDPVDDFEIHRNNLIYRNYQHNRNPFIDYPEWVDYIWGVAEYDSGTKTLTYDSTSTGSADPLNDVINGYNSDSKVVTKIEITKLPAKLEYQVGDTFDKTGMEVIATFDDESTQNVTSKASINVDMTSAGEKAVTVSYKGKTASFNINVKEAPAKKGIPMWVWIVVGAGVVVLLIIGISIGVISVNKKGKIKVKKSGVKKVIKKSNSKKKK